MEQEQTKQICSRCKEEKDVKEFYKCNKRKALYQNNCKSCNKDIVSKWQKEHREELNSKVDKEKRKTDLRNWYDKNKDKHIERVMAYNEEKYNNDPFYRVVKELYHMVYRYNKLNDFDKSESTQSLVGYSTQELREYFRKDIEGLNAINEKHRLEQIIPTKMFVLGTPCNIVCSLINLRILSKDMLVSKKDIFVSEELYLTVFDKYIKEEYKKSIFLNDSI